MEAKIAFVFYVTGFQALQAIEGVHACLVETPDARPLATLTLCFVVLKNGFVIVGKSAPASAENFDAEKGCIFAYEDAIKQLWPLEGYALRERLAEQAVKAQVSAVA